MKGKIYWVSGNIRPVRGTSPIQVSEISNVVISDNEISFGVNASEDVESGYVRLQNTTGSNYKGKANLADDDESIAVTGVLYESNKSYMLQGSWVESSEYFTWLAKIAKE